MFEKKETVKFTSLLIGHRGENDNNDSQLEYYNL